ncbi:hypothetical protein ABVT39_022367 [Epinephelus coioides]
MASPVTEPDSPEEPAVSDISMSFGEMSLDPLDTSYAVPSTTSPSTQDSGSGSGSGSASGSSHGDTPRGWAKNKWLVNESKVMELFKRCSTCRCSVEEKSVKKKLVTASTKKDNKDLQPWVKSIINHLYWSCESCKGDQEECVRRWKSLLHHICGVHRWEENGVEHTCHHSPLAEEHQSRRKWIKADSPPFQALKAIVMDRSLLQDLKQMSRFKHTGEPRHKFVYSKQSQQWIAKPIYERTQQTFRHDLVERALRRREHHSVTFSEPLSQRKPHCTRLLHNIAPVPRPEKEELLAQHSSRFQQH